MKKWIDAARLRTLPLALSSIITGSACALVLGGFEWSVFIWAVSTTILLQVLSNYANDYGDGVKGTDRDRIGPKRAVQSGEIEIDSMKKAIQVLIGLTFISGLALIYFSHLDILLSLLFLMLGIASLAAAYRYTAGKNPYGYRAMGDVFVFVFFGWVGVIGSTYLFIHCFTWSLLLPATTIGLLSVGVLHLNNMRDMENDKVNQKITVANILGLAKSKWYFLIIVTSAMISIFTFTYLRNGVQWNDYLFLIVFPILIMLILKVFKTEDHRGFDAFLKPLALSTFMLSCLFLLGLYL